MPTPSTIQFKSEGEIDQRRGSGGLFFGRARWGVVIVAMP
jgi:hypothetical protein